MPILLTENCIGCGACVEICKPHSIELRNVEGGVQQAFISEEGCTGCGRCKVICPQLRSIRKSQPFFYAYQQPQKELLSVAQSGGAFGALCKWVFSQGGKVVGVRYTNNCRSVEYSIADDAEGVDEFHGSKYVLPRVSDIIPALKEVVESGRLVMFVGLPCHCAAVRNLFKNKDNLLIVDVLCYGPMSPEVWKSLMDGRFQGEGLKQFYFRDKTRTGWNNSEMSFVNREGKKAYLTKREGKKFRKFFGSGVAQAEPCLRCKFRTVERIGDLTLGDFWGIDHFVSLPSLKIHGGISLILCNTEKGESLMKELEPGLIGKFDDFDELKKFNGGLNPSNINEKRHGRFWKLCKVFGVSNVVRYSRLLGVRYR